MAASRPNIWAYVAAALPPSEQLPIDLNDPNISNSVEDVLRYAKLMRERCNEKHKFKQIGDTIVQYDPVHAALPWAAVRFVLQIAVNDQQVFGAMAEGLELVSNLITRCAVWEDLYLMKNSAMQDQFIEALLKLYAAVLVYLGKAGKYYKQNTAERFLKSAIQSPERYIKSIIEKQALVEDCTQLMSSEVLHSTQTDIQSDLKTTTEGQEKLIAILQELDLPITRTATQVSALHDALNENERSKFLDWLSCVQLLKHHNARVKLLLPGSCKWLFEKEIFRNWARSSASSILWLHGIPGSGKSMLTCSFIEKIKADYQQKPSAPLLAYFYCSRDTAEFERSDPDEVLRSILEQLSTSCVDTGIREETLVAYRGKKMEARGRRPEKLGLEESTKIILQVLEENPAIIVIDALDECDPLQRINLISALRRIIQDSASVVKVFLSSRDDRDIVVRMDISSEVYIKAEDNSKDIESYTMIQVERAIREARILHGAVSETLKMDIIGTLISKANGMFRLVSSHIQSLCNPRRIKTEDNVRAALATLPKELHETYAIIMRQVFDQELPGPEIAITAMKWLIYARRQLKAEEFLSAITVNPVGKCFSLSNTAVLDICCNFVVYESVQNVFRFAHLSVREFLEKDRRWSSSASNSAALHRCLDVTLELAHTGSSKLSGAQNKRLSSYATAYWPQHRRYTATEDIEQELQKKLKRFWSTECIHDLYFAKWILVSRNFRQFLIRRKDLESLFAEATTAAETSFVSETPVTNGKLIQYLFNPRQSSDHTSLLHLAAAPGDTAATRLLIQAGAQVNLRNSMRKTPLTLTIDNGAVQVAQILLENGADVERGGSSYEPILLAAIIAADAGLLEKTLKDIASRAVEEDLSNELQTLVPEPQSLLIAAVRQGTVGTVQALLKSGLCSTASKNYSALEIAVSLHRVAMVKLLEDHQACLEDVIHSKERDVIWTAHSCRRVWLDLPLGSYYLPLPKSRTALRDIRIFTASKAVHDNLALVFKQYKINTQNIAKRRCISPFPEDEEIFLLRQTVLAAQRQFFPSIRVSKGSALSRWQSANPALSLLMRFAKYDPGEHVSCQYCLEDTIPTVVTRRTSAIIRRCVGIWAKVAFPSNAILQSLYVTVETTNLRAITVVLGSKRGLYDNTTLASEAQEPINFIMMFFVTPGARLKSQMKERQLVLYHSGFNDPGYPEYQHRWVFALLLYLLPLLLNDSTEPY